MKMVITCCKCLEKSSEFLALGVLWWASLEPWDGCDESWKRAEGQSKVDSRLDVGSGQ